MMKLTSRLALVLVSIFGVGCVDIISEREGAELQVVPITYILKLQIKDVDVGIAKEELDKYLEQNWDKFATQQLTFTWYTKLGHGLAQEYHETLLSKGLNRSQLIVKQGVIQESELESDLTFETTVNRVFAETCSYERVGVYGVTESGCYADSARWQSMVNPEKMLSSK